jgi:predicted metal-binding membrane protein
MRRIMFTDRFTPAVLLVLATAALSWAYVMTLDTHGMDVGALLRPRAVTEDLHSTAINDVSRMEMSDSGSGDPIDMSADSHAMPVPMFLLGWVAMMAAMMLPAVVPMILLVNRWSRSQAQPAYRLVPFVAGYLFVWALAGAFYFALIALLGSWIPSSEEGARIAASVLLVSGVYQFSPLKDRCLTACRTPLGFLMTYGGRMARGSSGYLEVGARHGLFCLGCCWMLMVILVLLGVMNILWMLLIAGIIFVEKVPRFGAGFAKLAGAAVAAVGATIVIAPGLIL